MAVLYRKYRPQTFAEVLNQRGVIQTLKNQISAGSVAHAYLFTGSRGVGKTSVARILAKAVNCTSTEAEKPCGACDNCKAIAAGSFLDLVEVDAASNTGVENIRELIEHVKFSPSLGKYKVFIIDEVHMLSKGAFNALLKTLEEPPKHAIFILATTEINKVPATIISRTQRFDFKAYSASDLFELLEKISKEENLNFRKEILELVAENAQGSARDALSLLDKVSTLGGEATTEDCRQLLGITDLKICENLLQMIALGQASELPDFFASLAEKGLDYVIFNRDFLEFLRKILIYKVSEGKISFDSTHAQKIGELSEKLSVQEIIFIIRLFLKSYKDLSASPSAEIPMLLAAIEASLKKPIAGQPVNKPASKSMASEIVKAASTYIPEPPVVQTQTIAEVQEIITVLQSEEQAITLEDALNVWPKAISKIKEVNGPLASMMKNCQLVEVVGNRIILGVKFAFDKQSLENMKNAGLITATLENISGKRIAIGAQVLKAEPVSVGTSAEALNGALKVFGGELIE